MASKIPTSIRLEVLGSHPVCHWCGFTGEVSEFDADHLLPRSKGGADVITNLVPACQSCNRSRQDKPAEEAASWVGRSRHIRQTADEKEAEIRSVMASVFNRRRSVVAA